MIVGTNNIIDYIRLNKAPYWKIFLGGSSKGSLFAKADDENPNLPVEDSILRLKQVFDLTSPGRYYITVKQEIKDTKGIFESHFEIPASDKIAQIGSLQPMQTGITPDEVAQKIAGALDEYKKQVEIEAMRKELAELKRDRYKPTPFENAVVKIVDAAGPQLNGLLKEVFNVKQAAAVPAVSGSQQENKEARQEKLEKALSDLNTVFPDLDIALTDLAEFAKKDPEKARQFLPMVKNL